MKTAAFVLIAGMAIAAASRAPAQSVPQQGVAALPTAADAAAASRPLPAAPEPLSTAGSTPGPIEDAELAGLNGRQGSTTTVLSDQDLTAVNRGNTITANTVGSGPITLGAGVFEGFAGVGNFVINSGHNNNLQGALTINIVAPQ